MEARGNLQALEVGLLAEHKVTIAVEASQVGGQLNDGHVLELKVV